MDYFHFLNLIKERKEIQWSFGSKVFYSKRFSNDRIVNTFRKMISLSFALPKHTPSVRSYNVCACRSLCRCTSL